MKTIPLKDLLNPSQEVLEAMAQQREGALKRNRHGEYGYRDMWLAGVNALIRKEDQ